MVAVVVHIRMNDKIRARLKHEAIDKNTTLNSLILQKLSGGLNE